MRTFVIATLAMLVAVPASAESTMEKSGINSVFGIAPSTEDFVTEAATGDMFEVASSKLALERSDDATKAFAQQMINDHTKTSADLKALIASHKINVTLPTAVTSAQQEMLDKLQKLQGESFTRKYHANQVRANTDAVDLFKRYGNGGDQVDIKEWARKTLPTLERHLDMANVLNRKPAS
ncbi:DUF4142 domain-containing protein [Pseudaminobacter soli (ex Li et al. 2025)]|uniref:DUF305 domain-containing protein n=1 Tax=Pseudaminobacter soli (ex Li et al. 2025) TaxID=1295366 RepID=A0A2P7S1B2_9HYPH|nr:DUF4142 domain-containing protein [Mesorhizobium soli]PSJ56264.1 DUF305 domain-containing protein [Mesorhizobium soli]